MSCLLKGFMDYMEGGEGGHATTMWNMYQEHFELKEGEEAPLLRVHDLSCAWWKFQDSMTEDGLKEFFTLSRKLHAAKNPETLGSRKHKFGKLVDTYNCRLENDFEQFDIQAFMVLVGAHVNEDSSVGAVIGTGGLVTVFNNHFNLEGNDLLGIIKTLGHNNALTRANLGQGMGSPIVKSKKPRPLPTGASPASAGRRLPRCRQCGGFRLPLPRQARDPGDRWPAAWSESAAQTPSQHHQRRAEDAQGRQLGRHRRRLLQYGGQIGFPGAGLADHLCTQHLRIYSWPSSVRLPPLCNKSKASDGLRQVEKEVLEDAVNARMSSNGVGLPYQGFRIEKHIYGEGDMVVYTHDYDVSGPAGRPSDKLVVSHWRTFSKLRCQCMDADGFLWDVEYDLDKVRSTVGFKTRGVLVPIDGSKEKGKGKQRAAEAAEAAESQDSEEEEDTLPPPTHKTRRPIILSEGDDSGNSDDEPVPAPPPVNRKRASTATAKPKKVQTSAPSQCTTRSYAQTQQQQGGGSRPVAGPSVLKSSMKPSAAPDVASKRVTIALDSESEDNMLTVDLKRRHIGGDEERNAPPPPPKRLKPLSSIPVSKRVGVPIGKSRPKPRPAPKKPKAAAAAPPSVTLVTSATTSAATSTASAATSATSTAAPATPPPPHPRRHLHPRLICCKCLQGSPQHRRLP
ncbi:hypothetical protein B0H17DRAFT_1125630 [Mycena rosella]|uniref:Uncharacterized protein n=1 Tax=Mycena rosella TaxID=1033263 RepID=A0AAD7M9N2_MYCRO|nr:hypothetical protein B0H17DRAFT_1125630 [Mycena rosella]